VSLPLAIRGQNLRDIELNDLTISQVYVGVSGLGQLFRVITFILLLIHFLNSWRYVCLGFSICCDIIACAFYLYQWLEIVTRMATFQTLSKPFEAQMKRIQKAFSILVSFTCLLFLFLVGVGGGLVGRGDLDTGNLLFAAHWISGGWIGSGIDDRISDQDFLAD